MPQVINTNVMSLNAQRNLTTSGNQLATALQRLSSGLRINSAKDDAAGLAISDRMSTQISGLNQAVRNSNDGISLAQTTEGALQEVTNNLQRIRELAVQSANATNSDSDRKALDQEVQQRLAEIQRIASQTSFNGRKVLDGSFGGATFQVGANVGETITLNLNTSMKTADIGKVASTTGAVMGESSVDISALDPTDDDAFKTLGTKTFFGVAVDFDADYTAGATDTFDDAADNLKTALNAVNTSTGFNVTNSGGVLSVSYTLASGDLQLTLGNSSTATNITGTFTSVQDLANAITSQTGGAVTGYVDSDGKLALASSEKFTVGGTTGALADLGLTAATVTLGGSLAGQDVKTAGGANKTILSVDAALTAVSDLRSTLGAIQNRFQSTINSLQAVSENLSASRSRILDTDFAAETASMTRAQILQQAGVAMVAQANAVPQNVLSLLR
ncbi:MAG TPA: flagellin [Steroidobacteraceae bacterium]|jgi:flagellin|nr:flagellin [Steroidobacteraceae bacterium]